jgi:hypothetical protein
MSTRGATTATMASHKFTGKDRDSESGLDNFEARYNLSGIGRLISPDLSNAVIEHRGG